jgi:hypothetical protein
MEFPLKLYTHFSFRPSETEQQEPRTVTKYPQDYQSIEELQHNNSNCNCQNVPANSCIKAGSQEELTGDGKLCHKVMINVDDSE